MMRVHELKTYGLKVTVSSEKTGRGLVEIALGSEVRTLSLNDFTSFGLEMVEISRQGTSAELNLLMDSSGKDTTQSLQKRSSIGKKLRTQSTR